MLFAATPPPKVAPKSKPKSEPRVEVPAAGMAGRWSLAIVALLVVLGGAYGGYEFSRWSAKGPVPPAADVNRQAEQEAKQRAEAAAAKKKADEDEAAKAQAEARRKAELAEQETRRQAEAAAAAARKKADEEEAARAEAEAKRKADLAEQERRRQEASLGTTSFDGVWEITRVGTNCFAQSHVFGVTIENGTFAQGFGTVSPSGDFKLLGRSLNSGRRDLTYIGTLSGTSGSGTFQADGGNCSGTFTAKRRG
jgi:hypothetical protein